MNDGPSTDQVTIRLDRDLALAFFEWSYQFMTDGVITLQHPADAIALDHMASELERTLSEPFQSDYETLLDAARERALTKYRQHMGEEHSRWLDALDYQEMP